MASNYTENFSLCQWEATDQVLRTEFNEDNAKVDAVLVENMAAITALTVQLSAKGNCQIETFSYTGTGTYGEENPTVIEFSGAPLLYVILGYRTLVAGSYRAIHTQAIQYDSFGSSTYMTTLTTAWAGPQLQIVSTRSGYQQINEGGQTYQVIALYAEDADT